MTEQLIDPMYGIPERERRLLEGCVHASVLRTKAPLLPRQRIELSDRLATTATLSLLKQLEPEHKVEDANALRRNQPGYDFLIDGWLRVQLKGGSFVESIGWTHKDRGTGADLEFDVLIVVDLGVTLEGRVGRLAGRLAAPKSSVDFYVIPGDVVRQWVDARRYVNGRGNHIYTYKYELRPGTKEETSQTRDLVKWRGRFDVLADALRKVT